MNEGFFLAKYHRFLVSGAVFADPCVFHHFLWVVEPLVLIIGASDGSEASLLISIKVGLYSVLDLQRSHVMLLKSRTWFTTSSA